MFDTKFVFIVYLLYLKIFKKCFCYLRLRQFTRFSALLCLQPYSRPTDDGKYPKEVLPIKSEKFYFLNFFIILKITVQIFLALTPISPFSRVVTFSNH